jgi:Zn-dependent M16 (insulinase) family peptidase
MLPAGPAARALAPARCSLRGMRAAVRRWARPAGASSAARPRCLCSAASPAAAETPRGKSRAALVLQPGDELSGFVIQTVEAVDEYQVTAITLQHTATGARYIHLDCEDTDNVFAVAFPTIPDDSTGVAHVLEHTVLCGSEKYPVRDPFFNMTRRSLNTYMNAFTASDFTMYPFSTQNEADYRNLLSVYLDATFFPVLREADFRQEGHRLEFDKHDDPESALQYKGIVFNEMKGAISNTSALFSYAINSKLYPGTTYRHNSGGDPTAIPNLTYEQLVNFHKTHYHPTNAYFYSYGDLSLATHLASVDQTVLSRFEPAAHSSPVPDVTRRTAPLKLEISCAPDAVIADPTRQAKVSVNFLTNNVTDHDQTFAMSVMSYLLLSGPNAPMYKALIEPNLATGGFAPTTGYGPSSREASFGIGLSGVAPGDIPDIRKRIAAALEQTADGGFDEERVQSVLHLIELGQKHVTTGRGISLAQRMARVWMHGGDPVEALRVDNRVATMVERMAAGPYLQELVRHL